MPSKPEVEPEIEWFDPKWELYDCYGSKVTLTAIDKITEEQTLLEIIDTTTNPYLAEYAVERLLDLERNKKHVLA